MGCYTYRWAGLSLGDSTYQWDLNVSSIIVYNFFSKSEVILKLKFITALFCESDPFG